MIVIVDYGRGNLRSAQKGLERATAGACDVRVSGSASTIKAADGLVLPGVGAFGDAIAQLRASGLAQTLVERAHAGVPLLGICLGMQLLLDESLEFGHHEGLGLVSGVCRPLPAAPDIKIPHMGWNTLSFPEERCALFAQTPSDTSVYFVHSYYCDVADERDVAARTEYGIAFPSALAHDNIFGVQFHPEKSSTAGLKMLRQFASLVE